MERAVSWSFTYNNLTLSVSNVKTLRVTLTVNGILSTLAGCTLNMGTNQLLGTLTTIINSGAINSKYNSNTSLLKTWESSAI
jgi:hypothetical protein